MVSHHHRFISHEEFLYQRIYEAKKHYIIMFVNVFIKIKNTFCLHGSHIFTHLEDRYYDFLISFSRDIFYFSIVIE